MENEGFIKDDELLKESPKVEDQLGIQSYIDDFEKRVESMNGISIIGLVGAFGSGKSTMLYQIEKKLKEDENVFWFNFDAWKYPDRKHLWDGFILDLALLVGKQDDTLGKIEARSILDIFDGFTGVNVLTTYLKKVTNQIPVTRIFEYEEILTKLLNTLEQETIYIILEDVDRADKEGRLFLETLRQFLNNLEITKNIIVIVPIGNSSYISNKDSYQKCFDYTETFNLRKIDLENFIKTIINEEFLEGKTLERFVSWLNYVMKKENISMRLLKQILRRANVSFKRQIIDGHEPWFEVTIAFELAKHLDSNVDEKSEFDLFLEQGKIINTSLIHVLLFNIEKDTNSIYIQDEELNVVLDPVRIFTRQETDRKKYPSKPYYFGSPMDALGGPNEYKIALCDFYLDY